MIKANKFFLSVMILSIVAGASGCVALLAGAAGGAGAAVWMSNKLGQDVNGPQEQAVIAAKAALKDLNLPLSKETTEADLVQLRSDYYDKSEIWIDVRRLTPQTCRIEVRVGVPGDKDATRKVFNAILKRL
jgi:hypothetical protein